jgi:COP9 signalosome complex subunit 7
VTTIRELEDLIIEGTNNNVLRGKLDQKSSHFEVDYAMGRDIKKVNWQY